MAKAGGKGKGCLRIAGLGCAGLVALVLLALAGTAVVGVLQRPGEAEPTEQSLQRALPAADPVREAESTEPGLPRARPAGRLILDLADGRFEIDAGPPGGPLVIQADYDAAVHELTEVFDEGEGGAWTHRVTFRSKVSWLGKIFGGKRKQAVVRISIPPDVLLGIEGEVSRGQSRMLLGGLSLSHVDLDVSMGQHEVRVDAPLAAPLDSFRVEGGMGQLTVVGLGNASPLQAELRHEWGQLTVSLDGEWRRGADVNVRFRGGQCVIFAPPEVALHVVNAHVDGGETIVPELQQESTDVETGAAVIRLDATGVGGELRIKR